MVISIYPTVLFLLLYSALSVAGAAEEKIIMLYDPGEGLESWEQESFVGDTRYDTVQHSGRAVIRAVSERTASALYREIPVKLVDNPCLNWKWRVENVLPITDPEQKAGDDYPARVYVVFRYGFFPWQVRALNYVWANRKTDKNYWKNPYTGNAVMIPLQAGEENLGMWITERVNVLADYRRIFGENIETIEGVAIMTDTDDSASRATAYYDEIYFSDC